MLYIDGIHSNVTIGGNNDIDIQQPLIKVTDSGLVKLNNVIIKNIRLVTGNGAAIYLDTHTQSKKDYGTFSNVIFNGCSVSDPSIQFGSYIYIVVSDENEFNSVADYYERVEILSFLEKGVIYGTVYNQLSSVDLSLLLKDTLFVIPSGSIKDEDCYVNSLGCTYTTAYNFVSSKNDEDFVIKIFTNILIEDSESFDITNSCTFDEFKYGGFSFKGASFSCSKYLTINNLDITINIKPSHSSFNAFNQNGGMLSLCNLTIGGFNE